MSLLDLVLIPLKQYLKVPNKSTQMHKLIQGQKKLSEFNSNNIV